ncbi:MAG: integrase [Nitrososphaerota archaeon]
MLLEGDLSPLLSAGLAMRRHTLRALAALSKFLGMHDEFIELRRRYGVKWDKGETSRLIIKRLTGEIGYNVLEWITRAYEIFDDDQRTLFRYLIFTGVRVEEACSTWGLIHVLGAENIHEYYNERMSALEHYRYPKLFLRRTKTLYVSFVTRDILEDILRGKRNKITWWSLAAALRKHGLPSRFGDVRELWATRMIRDLSQPEIDFLQGRITQSVFMRHYFNASLLPDLRDRTLRAAEKLLNEVIGSP